MDVVGGEEGLLDGAVLVREVGPEVEDFHVRIAVELEGIEGGVGLFDVFVKAIAGRVGWQNLRHDDGRGGKLLAEVLQAHLDAFGGGLDAGFGSEEHVVVADHKNDGLRLKAIDTAVVEAPEHVLRFIAADADVHGFEIGEVLFPGIAPLDRDAVADEQDVDGALVLLHGFHMGLVEPQPGVAAEMPGGRHLGPKLRQMLVRLAARTAIMFRLINHIGTFFGGEGPAGLLGFGGDVWVFESDGGEGKKEEEGRTDHLG